MTETIFKTNCNSPIVCTHLSNSHSNTIARFRSLFFCSVCAKFQQFIKTVPLEENSRVFPMMDGHTENEKSLIQTIIKIRQELKTKDEHLRWLKRELKRKKALLEERDRNIDQLKSVLDQKIEITEEQNIKFRQVQPYNIDVIHQIKGNRDVGLTDNSKTVDMSLSRIKKKGVSGESFSKMRNVSYAPYEKDEKSQQLIRDAIINNNFLKNLDSSQIDEISRCMYAKKVEKDSFIIREGEPGDALYVSADGLLEVTRQGKFLGSMAIGRAFGEIALLYDCKRTASVKAITKSTLWVLCRQVYQKIMVKSSLQRHEENLRFLRSVPVFENVSEIKLHKLADVLESVNYEAGDYIIRQGEIGRTFYVIHTGCVRVTLSKNEREDPSEICVLGPGEWFGERALYTREKRSANIITVSPTVNLLCLDKSHFINLIGDVNAIKSMKYQDPESYPFNTITEDEESIEFPNLNDVSCEKISVQSTLATSSADEPVTNLFHTIQFDDLIPLKIIGIGGFGHVKLVIWKYDQTKSFALKSMAKNHIVHTRQQEHIISERNLMFEIKSPFVCRLYATFRDSKYVHMLLEACLGGEVWTILRNRENFNDTITRYILASVLEAFTYLHAHDIVYRDLKPENLLLDEHGYLKICDFGFAKKLPLGKKTWTFCGTPEYVAPEVILNKGHDFSVDYWSLGILTFELLTGSPPFTGNDPLKIYNIILLGINAITFPPLKINRTATALIHRLCEQNPVERLGYGRAGICDIKEHKYFQGFDWSGLYQHTLIPPILPEVYGPTDSSNFDCYPEDVEIPLDESSGWDIDF